MNANLAGSAGISAVTELRLQLLRNGFTPIPITSPDAPVKDAGKAPTLRAWQTADVSPEAIRGWARVRPSETNTGLRTGLVVAIDLDVHNADLIHQLRDLAIDTIGPTPLERVGQAPKHLLVYRADTPFRKHMTERLLMPDGQHALVECLASGQQFVGFGTHPVTGQAYQWGEHSPLDVRQADLPAITEPHAAAFIAEAERLLRGSGGRPQDDERPEKHSSPIASSRPASSWPPPTRQDVVDALKAVPNTCDWHWWVKIGAAIYDALADNGEDLFIEWSAQSSKNDPKYTRRKWRSFRKSTMDTHAATLFWKARQNGWRPAAELQRHADPRRKETIRDAFRMLRRGMDLDDLTATLHAWNRQRPNPLPDDDIVGTARWASAQWETSHAAR